MAKNETVFQYLREYIYPNVSLKLLVQNYTLSKIPAQVFLKKFNLPDDKEKVVGFIMNPDNGYDLGKFGYEYDSNIIDEQIIMDNDGNVKVYKKKRGLI